MARILSSDDKRKIEEKIAEVETLGDVEIVVAEVERSDAYLLWRGLGSGLLTLSAVLTIHYGCPLVSADWLIALQLPLLALSWFLCGLPPLLRLLAPDALEQAAVHRQAKLAFLDNNIAETKNRVGVLLLISALEKRVEILADRGIHEKVQTEGWQQHVKTIVQAIHEKRAAEGICKVIHALATQVGEVLPLQTDDENELANKVVSH
ncbi:MAG: hypothetical protein IPJ88_17250 [Myxococcales bacterium]|nr:MAG: hypothetical protein IPJ88_17250 [Myxococcales bacterium]